MVFLSLVSLLVLTFWECNEEKRKNNLITTRIMRLRGLEEGLNKGPEMDSYDRYIYIHGTNHEDRWGNRQVQDAYNCLIKIC